MNYCYHSKLTTNAQQLFTSIINGIQYLSIGFYSRSERKLQLNLLFLSAYQGFEDPIIHVPTPRQNMNDTLDRLKRAKFFLSVNDAFI